MPKRRKGEPKSEYMKRCIKQLVNEEGKSPEQAAAICYSMADKK